MPDRLIVRYSHLDQWFNNPYEIDWIHDGSEQFDEKWIVKLSHPQVRAAFTYDQIQIQLETNIRGSMAVVIPPDGKTWSWGYQLQLTPNQPRPIPWLLQAASALREFLTLVVGSGVYTLDVLAYLPGGEFGKEVRVYIPVNVPRVVRTEPRFFNTQFDDLRDSLPELVATWFERRAQNEVATRAYTELLTSDGLTGELVLLRTLQTLEHLYSSIWPDQTHRVDPKVITKVRSWLAETLPSSFDGLDSSLHLQYQGYRDEFVRRTGSLNNIAFKSKIRRFLEEMPPQTVMPLLDNPAVLAPELDVFINRVEATRHFLTHFGKSLGEAAFKGPELEEAAMRCWAILSYWLAIHALGMSEAVAGDFALAAKNVMFLTRAPVEL